MEAVVLAGKLKVCFKPDRRKLKHTLFLSQPFNTIPVVSGRLLGVALTPRYENLGRLIYLALNLKVIIHLWECALNLFINQSWQRTVFTEHEQVLRYPEQACRPSEQISGTWYQLLGTWYLLPGTWYLLPGT